MANKGQYTYEYPHPAVTADSVVFGYDGKELKVLLIKRGVEKEASTTAYVGEWALPGGFLDVEKDKTVAHTAARELKEETGLSAKIIKEAGSRYFQRHQERSSRTCHHGGALRTSKVGRGSG